MRYSHAPEPRSYTPADEREDVERILHFVARRQQRDEDDLPDEPDEEPDPRDFETEQEYLEELEDLGIDPGEAEPWDDAEAT